MKKRWKIGKKVPIVVPKVAFWGTFGTTIGTFRCVYAVFMLFFAVRRCSMVVSI